MRPSSITTQDFKDFTRSIGTAEDKNVLNITLVKQGFLYHMHNHGLVTTLFGFLYNVIVRKQQEIR